MNYINGESIYFKKYLFFNIFILLFINVSSEEIKVGQFPYIKKLNSNRYIMISSEGIAFLDPTFTNSSNIIHFQGEDQYNDIYEVESTNVVQFPPEDGDLLFVVIYGDLYIFDSNEKLLNCSFLNNYEKQNEDKKPYYLIPYEHIDNNYRLSLIDLNEFDDTSNYLYLYVRDIKYDLDSNIVYVSNKKLINLETYPDEIYDLDDVDFYQEIACCLLNYNDTKKINCLYGAFSSFQIFSLDPYNDYEYEQRLVNYEYSEDKRVHFKYIVLPGNEKVIYCLSYFLTTNLDCIKYDASLNSYTNFHHFVFEGYLLFDVYFTAQYFEDTEQIVISLFTMNNSFLIFIYICDLEGNCEEKRYEQLGDILIKDIWDSGRINIIIPLDRLTYHIIFYSEKNETFLFDSDIEFELKCKKYFNYYQTSCIKSLPEGYYCNDSIAKTIDKCHPNCKICSQGPSNSDNNCLFCNENTNSFYDLGNCLIECPNGNFLDENNIPTCMCTNNISCLLCDKNGLCKSCKTQQGYYPKSDENNTDEFINCYKDPVGYYLDNEMYYPCYNTCKYCIEQGTEIDNKCTDCREGYSFNLDNENDKNCYEISTDNNHIEETTFSNIEISTLDSRSAYSFDSSFTTECTIKDLINEKCDISMNNKEIIKLLRDSIINNEINDILTDIIEKGKNKTMVLNDTTLQLIGLENQIINDVNTSIIDIGECEETLKQVYEIGNFSILLYKIDVKIPGYSAMIVNYELYNPKNYTKLNLDYCNKSSIIVKTPAYINKNELFKYDPENEYYKDYCIPNTDEDGVDIILVDRRSEFINNNLTLCENDCVFIDYDSINFKAICQCKIKNNIEEEFFDFNIDSDKFFEGFIDVKKIINLYVIKCYESFFTKNGFLKNIGNFILLSILLLFIISSILFCKKGYQKLVSKINSLINDEKIDKGDDSLSKKPIELYEIKKEEKKIKVKKKKRKSKILNKSKVKSRKTHLLKSNINLNDNKIKINHILSSQNSIHKDTNKDINIIDTKEKKDIKDLCDQEINDLNYKEAIEIDNRTYFQYYWSLIKKKQLIIFTFIIINDYNSYIIKIQLFLFAFALYLTVSALFFTENTIHQIYEDEGIFNFIYHFPQIIYSSLISAVINIIVKELSLTEKKILDIKKKKSRNELKKKAIEVLNSLKIAFIFFYSISFIFLILFWFYISCFCAVYRNTQSHLISNTLLSFVLSLLYPFVLNIIPMIMRMPALRSKENELLYKLSKIIQII